MASRESVGVSHRPSYPRVNIGSVRRDHGVRTRYTWRGAIIIRPQRNESIRINLRAIIVRRKLKRKIKWLTHCLWHYETL